MAGARYQPLLGHSFDMNDFEADRRPRRSFIKSIILFLAGVIIVSSLFIFMYCFIAVYRQRGIQPAYLKSFSKTKIFRKKEHFNERNTILKSLKISEVDDVVNFPYAKYGAKPPKERYYTFSSQKAGNDHSIPLDNFYHSQYYVEASVGEPPQNFRFIPDTGSPETWVPSSKCYSPSCFFHNRFDEAKSSTYKVGVGNGQVFNITYGSGSVEGFFAIDTFTVGDLKIKNQDLMTVTSESLNFLTARPDGIMGCSLNFPQFQVPPFMYHVKELGILKKNILSFHFGKIGENGNPDEDGEFMIGDYNRNLYKGEMAFFPVVEPHYWNINCESLSVSSSSLSVDYRKIKSLKAVVDTGTSLIAMNKEVADEINTAIGATPTAGTGFYKLDCDKLEEYGDLQFSFSGKLFTLRSTEYAIKISLPFGDTTAFCMSSIMGLDLPPQANNLLIIGDVFLRKYYSVFDYDNLRVGLAEAI